MVESKARGIRLKSESIERIKERAQRRGWTFNRWINWAIAEGLRSHKRKEK
jgi:predicted DNA binding CopG/RHH family protein